MATALKYLTLDNLGINGLNTQDKPTSINTGWLTKANNVVLEEAGTIGPRKGLKQLVKPTTAKVGAIGELGTAIFASVGATIIKIDFTDADALVSPDSADVETITGASSDWQFIEFNAKLYALQYGEDPMAYDDSLATPAWVTQDNSKRPASVSSGNFQPSCGMGYYGRLWVGGISGQKDVLYYSDTLVGDEWRPEGPDGILDNADDTAAGYLDLKKVWGTDEIIAIAPFYGKLVIFGTNNIAIYRNPTDPNGTDFGLDEVIRGVGCVSRDSVVAVADDLIFLSSTGVKSLLRTSEKDKLPLTELSSAIQDTIIRDIKASSNVKAVYMADEGFFLMSFVDLNRTYVFDLKQITEKRTPRVTTWSFDSDREPSCLAYTKTKGFLAGQQTGSVASYEGYSDKVMTASNTHTVNAYEINYTSSWIEVSEGVATTLLKNLKLVFNNGLNSTVSINLFKDFGVTAYKSYSLDLKPTSSGTPSYYNVAEFGIGEFAPVYGLKEYSVPLSGSVKHLTLGFDTLVNGHGVSLQDSTLLFKQGKIR